MDSLLWGSRADGRTRWKLGDGDGDGRGKRLDRGEWGWGREAGLFRTRFVFSPGAKRDSRTQTGQRTLPPPQKNANAQTEKK